MSLSINSNSAASSILSNLNNVQNEMNTSYQQLSTGNMVNSAADNPASYAISQQMTSQVNGLNQATQNAQNGISMIQTATGAMNQIEQVLQTMGTLANEASNAGNTYSDRANLQLEMNALAQQINSTTNQTQYNGINLLTGQFGSSSGSSLQLQIGANNGQTLSFNIEATDVASLGVGGAMATGVATTQGTITKTTYTAGTDSAGTATVSGTYSGTDTPAAGTANDGATVVSGTPALGTNFTASGLTGSVKVVYTANTSSTGTVTGGTLQLESASGSLIGPALSVTAGELASGGTVTLGTGTETLSFNLSKDSNLFSGATGTGNYTQTDSIALTAPITQAATPTGVGSNFQLGTGLTGTDVKIVYTANTSSTGTVTGGTLQLENASGVAIGGAVTVSAAQLASGGTVTLGTGTDTLKFNLAKDSNLFSATGAGTYSQVDTLALQASTTVSTGTVFASGAYTAGTGSATNGATSAGGDIASSITANNSTLSAGMNLKLVYTANTSASGTSTGGSLQLEDSAGDAIGTAVTLSAAQIAAGGTITVGDSSTNSTLSINLNADSKLFTGATGSGAYTQTDSFTLSGASDSSTQASASNNWSATASVAGINILTQSDAENAITKIQNAISTLSSSQAQLGAVQDRLNYTVSNLSSSSQNLQNADSTITNTDMASAYTQFSQQQVLEQVGISMLSQAQQQPQMILKLLQ